MMASKSLYFIYTLFLRKLKDVCKETYDIYIYIYIYGGDVETPPYYEKPFEGLEKHYINVTNYY